MKQRTIVQTVKFSKEIDKLLKKRLLEKNDFEVFQEELKENPESGDIIPGMNGIRKIRIKSSTKGKSGGFRICYYYLVIEEEIYLLLIYAKNKQENLTMEEKKIFREFIIKVKQT